MRKTFREGAVQRGGEELRVVRKELAVDEEFGFAIADDELCYCEGLERRPGALSMDQLRLSNVCANTYRSEKGRETALLGDADKDRKARVVPTSVMFTAS